MNQVEGGELYDHDDEGLEMNITELMLLWNQLKLIPLQSNILKQVPKALPHIVKMMILTQFALKIWTKKFLPLGLKNEVNVPFYYFEEEEMAEYI